MKYSIMTFGCRVNQADSLGIEEELRAKGASPASPEEADLVVVNTCSVTASADQGARQAIRRVARANPSAQIIVTGCYATRRPEEIRELPNVAGVVNNDDKPRLVDLVRSVRLQADHTAVSATSLVRGIRLQPDSTADSATTTAQRFGDGDGSCGAAIEPGVAGRTAFTLRVQTGCAEPCSYCIIPATRGTPRSVPIDAVLREVDRITVAGFKEIALTGVHLGSYGRDLEPRSSLIELLTRLADVSHARGAPPPLAEDFFISRGDPTPARAAGAALERRLSGSGEGCRPAPPDQLLFRISSLEPMDCTPEIVDLVARAGCFAPHFHLPLQHASDRVLAAMCRPYTLEQYAALVETIRSRIPHAAIGSDVIVGFPGETDADFEQLAEYLGRSRLTHVHVFPYSDRPGTPAAVMRERPSGVVVRERARRVREISARLSAAFRDTQIGSVHRALTLEDGSLVVTGNYQKLRIPPGAARNQWVQVRVASHQHGELLSG